MGILDRLLRRDKGADAATFEAPPCAHLALVARWDSSDDMGNEAKASHFLCTACNESFTPEQATTLRAGHGERLRKDLG